MPIIYGLGTFLTFNVRNSQTKYLYYLDDFLAQTDHLPATINNTKLNISQLENRVSCFRRKRDLSVIMLAILYFANIVDAHVDAHLKEFNINKKPNLSVGSKLQNILEVPFYGLALNLKLSH